MSKQDAKAPEQAPGKPLPVNIPQLSQELMELRQMREKLVIATHETSGKIIAVENLLARLVAAEQENSADVPADKPKKKGNGEVKPPAESKPNEPATGNPQ